MQGFRLTLASVIVSAAFSAAAPPALAAPQVEVIAKGLSNPRGLAFAPNGQLFVAEAGSGGDGKCIVLADSRTACYGETGALTRVDPTGKAAPVRVISGLPSMAAPGGFGALGAQGIVFTGAGNGRLVMGLAADASARTGLGAKANLLGQVLQVGSSGNWKVSADIAAFEAATNPVSGGTDSNPYAVAALGQQHIVADAGANALFSVAANGKISTLAKFEARPVPAPPFLGLPPGATIPMQAVPTTVIDGRDGWLYAGQLTGFPFPAGAANVYRVSPHGGTPEVYASGFTNIIGLAFDANHRLYVLQVGSGLAGAGGPPLLPPGRLVRVNANGSQTVIYQDLYYPGGLAIGPDGAAYVTNFGIVPGPVAGSFPDGGQVLRIPLD
ncbi:ScyD/ScyE family protein [Pseudoduganella sp. UC29_71]|uniref:ScyD/ScyE family protein n=1 Tax=Pseudoduganella sp. UC29_71 TaxID=3350174 RepID=UPI00366F25F7